MQVSPAMLAGISKPGGTVISAEALDLITRLRDHYREMGKTSAAHNYSRHLKSFFGWAENSGYSVKNLPPESLETFLSTLRAAGQKETTLYVMRTQLKSALKAASEVLGTEFGHLEYETGKPREVRAVQKAKEKRQRTTKRLVQTAQQLQALQAAQATIFGTSAAPVATTYSTTPAVPTVTDTFTDSDTVTIPEDDNMSDVSAPQPGGGSSMNGQQPVVVLQVPPQTQRPLATVGAGNQQRQNNAQPQRGVVLNNHTFNGPYIRVSYVADGSSVIPAGSEVALRVYPASQLAPHGDIATFLQSYVIPEMRLPPTVAQVQFVFHELNDRKQPTGRRDEMIVSVPAAMLGGGASTQPAPQQTAFGYAPSAAPSMDKATEFLLQKLDREAEEAKKRADTLQDEMKKANDAQTTFLLMQQFRREEDLRKELEERKSREMDRMRALDVPPPPPLAMTPAMPFPSILPPEPVRDNSAAEFAKALAESQKNMMELMLASMNRPQPVAPPPPVQKDAAEWLVPFMAQMNQQSQQQQQAQQQMIVQIMQANQQFMQALLTRENPTEKLLFAQLQEVKAAANAPKADELEGFADKLQKMKMVSDMLGGGSGNGSFLADLLANADVIGAGAAKVIQAAKTGQQAPTPGQLGARPTVQPNGTPQLTAGATPAASAPMIPAPPEEAVAHLKMVTDGVDNNDDQAVINGVVEIVKTFMAAPEPYPSTGRKILAAFKNADDEGELYTLAKNLWTVLGQQYDRPAAKAVAKVLAKWYSIIHQQIFGEPRELMADGEEADEGDEDVDLDTESSEDDHDGAPTLVAGG